MTKNYKTVLSAAHSFGTSRDINFHVTAVPGGRTVLLADSDRFALYAAMNKYRNGFAVYLVRKSDGGKYNIMGCEHPVELPIETIIPKAEDYIARFFDKGEYGDFSGYVVLSLNQLKDLSGAIRKWSRKHEASPGSGERQIKKGVACLNFKVRIITNPAYMSDTDGFQCQIIND